MSAAIDDMLDEMFAEELDFESQPGKKRRREDDD
jgi:hypothetical protein